MKHLQYSLTIINLCFINLVILLDKNCHWASRKPIFKGKIASLLPSIAQNLLYTSW